MMALLEFLIVAFPEAVLMAALGLVLAGVRPLWTQLAVIGALQAGTVYLARWLPAAFGLDVFLPAAAFVIAIRLVLRVEWKPAAVAGLLALTMLMATESVLAASLLYFKSYPLIYLLEVLPLRFFFFLPQAALLGLLIWLCLRFDFRLLGPSPGDANTAEDWRTLNKTYFPLVLLASLPVLFLGVLGLAFLAVRNLVFPFEYLHVFVAGIVLALLVFAAFLPGNIRISGRALADSYTARKTAETLARVGELLRSTRRRQHDFRHQLQTVYGLLETGHYEEARQYIRKTYDAISTPLELIRTDLPHATALLYTKLGLAEARQIRLEAAIECSLQHLPLNPLETGTVFGNLIDNALEAVENLPPPERVVRLGIRRDPEGYVISVANRGRPAASHPFRFFQVGFTTKSGHAGLGLATVRETVARYGGTVTVTAADAETVFTVRLPPGTGLSTGEWTPKKAASKG
ncbi:signal transduction histidine kinase regulating citrate/malate metabolism [Candidatus Desulforudis audaxviator MP104C]|uniref:Signal transduction histidine kinase regulating citrate/malate metabolism n=2 Tax=Candidatus Desulforudis TaxID=471826 RepID=B1I2Q4_DESAP|nr:signal transduction histidine kinase regulating citrate/malate metabolism [Candidatus Desulforudis audaxviator MP104C]